MRFAALYPAATILKIACYCNYIFSDFLVRHIFNDNLFLGTLTKVVTFLVPR